MPRRMEICKIRDVSAYNIRVRCRILQSNASSGVDGVSASIAVSASSRRPARDEQRCAPWAGRVVQEPAVHGRPVARDGGPDPGFPFGPFVALVIECEFRGLAELVVEEAPPRDCSGDDRRCEADEQCDHRAARQQPSDQRQHRRARETEHHPPCHPMERTDHAQPERSGPLVDDARFGGHGHDARDGSLLVGRDGRSVPARSLVLWAPCQPQ